jgi:hypothetical protein
VGYSPASPLREVGSEAEGSLSVKLREISSQLLIASVILISHLAWLGIKVRFNRGGNEQVNVLRENHRTQFPKTNEVYQKNGLICKRRL